MLIRVVDLETTGIEPTDKVVQIGAADLFMDSGEVVPAGETFINPGIPIPPLLSAIHHIIDSDVADAPSWPEGAQGIFRGWGSFSTPDAYCAHNAKFERQWIKDDLIGGKPWICTYRGALRVWPEFEGHTNQQLRYQLNPAGLERSIASESHRALPDAYVTALTLRELLKRASFDDLVAWSSVPALLPRVQFGKHKGEKWQTVPADYLQWILRQADMGEDLHHTARHHLELRKRG